MASNEISDRFGKSEPFKKILSHFLMSFDSKLSA